MITFNKPYLTGKELEYIEVAVQNHLHISGNGSYTKKCHSFIEEKYDVKKCLLTTSCTDALEMAALLINVQPGDEIIIPSYTFVSTALAFVRQGAKIIFADSISDNPNIDATKIEALITPKTKAIVPVHYAGVSCDMDKIMEIATKHNLYVIEDAAQAIDSFFISENGDKKVLGSIGHFGCFSFHETKNIQCGEGGMLVINDEQFIQRAEIIWEKGTNRAEFYRGEVNKYGWKDIGSSFLPSDLLAAFLFAQLENINRIQTKRKDIWDSYYKGLQQLDMENHIKLPSIPNYATNNAHMFFIICKSADERQALITFLKNKGVITVFHYLSLHQSEYYYEKHDGRVLPYSDHFSNCLLRLPMYYELEEEQVNTITNLIKDFFSNKSK